MFLSPRFNVWEWCAEFSGRYAKLILAISFLFTLFFSFFLLKVHVATDIRDFHRKDALNLIDTIEDDFSEGSYLRLTFETQTEESLLTPRLLKEQFKILQAVRDKFNVKIYSLVTGVDEGLKRNKRKTLLESDTYNDVGEAILALSGGRTVRDLEKVSRHYLSHPKIVEFYQKFRLAVAKIGGGQSGATKWEYETPFLKALMSDIQLDSSYSPQEQRKAVVEIRDLVTSMASKDLKVYAYANNLVSFDIDTQAQKHTAVMGLILLVVDFLLLWGIFRSKREVFLTLFILITSCIWTYGAAGLLGVNLSFLHLMVLPILLGTGIDDSVVFGRRFAEERARLRHGYGEAMGSGRGILDPLRRTYAATGKGIFLTTFTTSIAFLCAGLVNSSSALTSFYLLVSYSMVVVFVLTIFLQGPLRVLLAQREKGVVSPAVDAHPWLKTMMQGLPRLGSRWVAKYPRIILGVSALLFVSALFSITGVQSEFERRLFMRKDMPTYTADRIQDKYFGRNDVGYILIEGDVANRSLLQKMRKLRERMNAIPNIEKIFRQANVDSINDLIDKLRSIIKPKDTASQIFDLITTREITANYVTNDTFREAAEHVIRKKGDVYDGLLMKFYVTGADPLGTRKAVDTIEEEIQRLKFDEIVGINTRVGGGKVSFHIEEAFYFRNMIESFGLAIFLNFLVLLIVWRKWTYSLLAVIPLILSLAVTIGLMALFGIKLNVVNICLGAIVVGLGIDYPIHIIERFVEELKKNHGQRLVAAQNVLATMGPNIFGASLTTIVGFGTAMVLAMPITESFGLLTALTIFFVYVASIFLLPVLLVKRKA